MLLWSVNNSGKFLIVLPFQAIIMAINPFNRRIRHSKPSVNPIPTLFYHISKQEMSTACSKLESLEEELKTVKLQLHDKEGVSSS